MRFALSIMKISTDPAKATHAREIVERQVSHMTRLVDDLLYELRVRFVQAQQGEKRIVEP